MTRYVNSLMIMSYFVNEILKFEKYLLYNIIKILILSIILFLNTNYTLLSINFRL
jgi:hypothetical protein